MNLSFAIPIALVLLFAVAGAYWLGSRGDASRDSPNAGANRAADFGAVPGVGSPPPLTGTMREQADRLFERIMQARARGDQEEVEFFLPMALSAYEAEPDLDADGLFHLGLLQIEGGSFADARATANRIAEDDAGHLFGLALEAQAALAEGDTAAATVAFRRYLERFDEELGRGLGEYEVHRPALDEYREEARTLTTS